MTYEQKLKNITANKAKIDEMLKSTGFRLWPLSQVAPFILRSSANPHAYVIEDTYYKTVIPGLYIFMAFGCPPIAKLDCWMEYGDCDRRDRLECRDESDTKKVIDFIQTKAEIAIRYMRENGLLEKQL